MFVTVLLWTLLATPAAIVVGCWVHAFRHPMKETPVPRVDRGFGMEGSFRDYG